jgi:transposase InsO family protein
MPWKESDALSERARFALEWKRRWDATEGERVECLAPNQTWSMDFKGWFRLGTGEKCYPFTLLDAFSRLLLRCEALLTPTGDEVRSILDSAFSEYGLPEAIRSDGGPPFFASQGPSALSKLSVWLLRLGITLECIAPAKPQQNGRLERFHRTLKRFVDPVDDLSAQQRAFDRFRGHFDSGRLADGLVPTKRPKRDTMRLSLVAHD